MLVWDQGMATGLSGRTYMIRERGTTGVWMCAQYRGALLKSTFATDEENAKTQCQAWEDVL